MGEKRDKSIDIMKGMGILFVILGHISPTPRILKIWLYSFHMPLFFVCSGMVFSTDRYGNFRNFLNARIRQIVIPYFKYGILLWILTNSQRTISSIIFNKDTIVGWDPIRLLLSLFLGFRLHKYYYSMWFLCALFIGEIFFYFIVRFAKNKWYLYFLVVITAPFVQQLFFKYLHGFYWSSDVLPVCVGFLSMGYLFRSFRRELLFFKTCYLLPLVLSGSLLFMVLNYRVCGLTDLFACVIGNPLYYLFAAFFGCWTILIISNYLNYLKMTEFLGKNSLIIYIFQNSFSIPIANDLVKILSSRHEFFTDRSFQFLFVLSVTLIISYLLVKSLKKCRIFLNRSIQTRFIKTVFSV